MQILIAIIMTRKKNIILIIAHIFLMLVVTSSISKAQATLTIVIKNLESNDGNILLDFRDSNNKKLKEYKEKITNNQCVIVINGLSFGKYAFKYFHDKNNNNKLDTYWIGAPKEGYGFSNNAKGNFGPPDFVDTVFELERNTTVECKPKYIKF